MSRRCVHLSGMLCLGICGALAGQSALAQESSHVVPDDEISITVLTTNTADTGPFAGIVQGEWSFSAWVEAGDRAFLFDTGWSPDNVLRNAEILGIDLSAAEDLILSHHHADHTGGLETLRTELSKRNPRALSRIHVASGIFASRPGDGGSERNPMVGLRQRIEATGATFIVHEGPAEIAPGVWVTGPVPRVHEEQNYSLSAASVVMIDGMAMHDVIPESQSLVVNGTSGPVMVSGCGHAGLINSLEFVQSSISPLPPAAAIGGFHLYGATEQTLDWTSSLLAELGIRTFLGAHCTGFESVYTIRAGAGLDRDHARVGSIGTRYEGAAGIVPGRINR